MAGTETEVEVEAYGAAAVADAIVAAGRAGAATLWAPVPVPAPRHARHTHLRTAAHVVVALVVCTLAAAAAMRVAGARSPHADADEQMPVPAAVPVAPVDMPGPQVLPAGFGAWSATIPGGVVARAAPSPDADAVVSLSAVNEFGDPQTLGIVGETWGADGAAWVQAQLPVRPNGTVGWVPASAVVIEGRTMRIQVHKTAGTVVLLDHGQVAGSWPVAIGPDAYPTPAGSFFVWTKYYDGPRSAYGPGVVGLSGFSEVLDASNWPGDARIGLHGAASEASLGGRAGHGCVRMRDADVSVLLSTVPLGTPVDILD